MTLFTHGLRRALMTQQPLDVNMATAEPVVEEAEDYSFLPIIHDIIKW